MRTIEINLYKIDELTPEQQESVCEYVREQWHDFYPWHGENQQSLKEFAKFLGGKCDYSVSLYGPSAAEITDLPHYLTTDDEAYQSTDFIHDNQTTIERSCPFTGFHMDEYLLDPMREYLKDPVDHTMEELIQEGVDNWVKQYVADWEHCYTDEYIFDYLQANEYEFTEDGTIY